MILDLNFAFPTLVLANSTYFWEIEHLERPFLVLACFLPSKKFDVVEFLFAGDTYGIWCNDFSLRNN